MTTPDPEPTTNPEPNKNAKRNKNIGRVISIVSIFMSSAIRLWTAWLFPIVNTLDQQGRLHEGDSDGCFYGIMLMVPTIFIAPLIVAVAVVLALLGFHLKARVIAVIALIVAVIALIPLVPILMSFFGS
jgi:hypothetical protein